GNKLERPRGLRDPSSPLFLFPFPVFFSRREPRLPVPRLAGDSSSKSLLFTTRGGRRSNPSTIHLVSKGAFKENFSSSPQPLSSLNRPPPRVDSALTARRLSSRQPLTQSGSGVYLMIYKM